MVAKKKKSTQVREKNNKVIIAIVSIITTVGGYFGYDFVTKEQPKEEIVKEVGSSGGINIKDVQGQNHINIDQSVKENNSSNNVIINNVKKDCVVVKEVIKNVIDTNKEDDPFGTSINNF